MHERSIFMEALGLSDPRQRHDYIRTACGQDERLRARVEALLLAHEGSGTFLLDKAPALIPLGGPGEGPGDFIGPYKILEPLGEGGMGVVYVAEQQGAVRRKVALKVIKPGMDTARVIARFEAERQTLAMMDHPNIARVFDGGATGSGRPYFVMELVNGPPITEYCGAARLPTRGRLELFVLACRAVQHAHQKGIIHRDLKPSNILVTRQDGAPVPKVIDFGIAKAIGGDGLVGSSRTTREAFIGTPLYMSPEQVDPSGLDVDTRADVYSLGVLLYELLTGATPYDPGAIRSFDEIRRFIREVEPPRPSRIPKARDGGALRGELDWIVMKALEKDRGRRYESASGFADDVMRYLTNRPVEACPPSAWYRLRKFARRNRAAIAASASLAAALGIGSAESTRQASMARRAERIAVEARGEIARQRDRALAAERTARANAEEASRSAADTRAFGEFLVADILAAARPKGLQGGKGIDATVAEAIEAAEESLADRFAGRPLAEAKARDGIGKTWRLLARQPRAEKQLRRALELREAELGADAADTLDTRNSLGLLLGEMGRHREAITLLETALRGYEALEGPDGDGARTSMSNLALAYEWSGRPDQAVAMFERVHERTMARLGPEDPETLRSLANLAAEYAFVGLHGKALPLLEMLRGKMLAVYEPNHPATLVVMNNLACEYRDAGRIDEALPMFQGALREQEIRLGPDHPDTLVTRNNMGVAYREAGRLDESEPLMAGAAEGARRSLGPDHPRTQFYAQDLANLYWRMGRFAEAVPIFDEALAYLRRNSGDDHIDTIKAAFNRAVNTRESGQLAEAEKILDEWLPRAKAAFGLDHPTTLWGMDEAIDLFNRSRQPAKAEHLYRELARYWKEKEGPMSARYAQQLGSLGPNLLSQRRPVEAEEVLRECLAIREQAEPDAWTTFHTRTCLGVCALRQNDLERAEPWLVEGYEGMKRRQGQIPPQARPRLADALRHLVSLYEKLGREDDAERWRRELQPR